MALELRGYQEKALDAIEAAEREGVRRPLVVHPTGTGKGHPGHTDILTAQGWRKWVDLVPGDQVFGSSGTLTEVTAVYNRGVLPTYRVTFSDRSTIEVDGDHLWAVQDCRYRRTSWEYRVLSTWEIVAEGLMFGTSRRWAVPMTGAIEHANWEAPPIEAYTLGALIANGSMTGTGTQLTTPDPAVASRISAAHQINPGKMTTGEQCPRYSLPGLRESIRTLGLNVHSRDKFIPDRYLQSTVFQRVALLQGLMDGDGCSRQGRRTANYCTTSPRLAEDVRHLVMSLGGTATINSIERDRNGVVYQDIAVMILAPSQLELFSSSRKKGRTAPRRTFEPRRTIVAIDRVEDQEIRCITVAAPDHLYVVGRDFIVTHNTVTFSHAIKRRADRGRALVMVHRDELATQTRNKIRIVAPELSTGIVKAELNEVFADVVIASVQTGSRDARLAHLVESARRSPFGTIVCDEAHHAPAPTWTKMLTGLGAFNPYGPLSIGFTATPERDNGKTLGVWEKVVSYMSIREAIYGNGKRGKDGHEGGFLVPILPAVVVETKMDMRQVRKTGGDYSDGDLGRELESSGAIVQIADSYVEHGGNRKAIAFTPTVATAHALAAALRARGVAAEALDGGTEIGERQAILRRLKIGDTRVVVNCAVLTEGFDEPSISCVIVARPTRFHGLYVQMVGRGTRLYPGKRDLLVLDIVGASNRHELISLVDLGLDMDDPRTKKEGGAGQECPSCDGPGSECNLDHHRCELCRRFLPRSLVSKSRKRHDNCHAGSGGRVNVFGTSRLRWLPVGPAWVLGAGQEVVVMVPEGLDTWRLATYRAGKVEVIHDEIPVDWAMGIGEDRAKAFQKLVERSARWLGEPATDQQKGRLLREGLPEKVLPRVRTKGDASDLLTRIQGRRAVKKLGVCLSDQG